MNRKKIIFKKFEKKIIFKKILVFEKFCLPQEIAKKE